MLKEQEDPGAEPYAFFVLAKNIHEAQEWSLMWRTLPEEAALTMRGVYIFGSAAEAREAQFGDLKVFENCLKEIS